MTEKKDQGYTMIIVMCLMFLFMALALSMLFSSAQLLARAERAGMQKQSRASAVSFAEWMDKELAKGSAASGLCATIKDRIYTTTPRWPSYTGESGHDEAVAVRELKPDTTDASDLEKLEKLGDLEVSMYWETTGEDRPDSNDEMDPDVYLVVTVKAVVKDEQYSITTRYEKNIADSGEGPWDGKWSLEGRE